eukprot:CAMPEP_0175094706 /NCGR_PEP_ID=MMETSP0086_2-20121207/3744_1 /TAXON_ID=136419 /ORGANISM="Unknown Unknown, Strain D1" /LENGTH=255 /DNA_ID=CAMNT_0016367863 /DNA_START=29 /DNA_END=796 /DNA_ORIENTATION=+
MNYDIISRPIKMYPINAGLDHKLDYRDFPDMLTDIVTPQEFSAMCQEINEKFRKHRCKKKDIALMAGAVSFIPLMIPFLKRYSKHQRRRKQAVLEVCDSWNQAHPTAKLSWDEKMGDVVITVRQPRVPVAYQDKTKKKKRRNRERETRRAKRKQKKKDKRKEAKKSGSSESADHDPALYDKIFGSHTQNVGSAAAAAPTTSTGTQARSEANHRRKHRRRRSESSSGSDSSSSSDSSSTSESSLSVQDSKSDKLKL